jgi:hypothetical protein
MRTRISDTIWTARERLRSASERAFFPLQKRVIWPLADRVRGGGESSRVFAFAAVMLAAGVGVAALLVVAPGDNHSPAAATTVAEVSHPLPAPKAAPAKAPEPTLHGAAPVFKSAEPEGSTKVDPAQPLDTEASSSSKPSSAAPAATEETAASTEIASSDPTATSSSSTPGIVAPGPPAGPAAITVAREFAGAFVLYETGQTDSAVHREFSEAATPQLTHALMRRPPRLPANVTVPQAKVVNVVAAPSHGTVYPVSVSLLRVGVTSELRLEMEQLKGKRWRVTNVLG